jgi:hypothetical protein
MEVKKSPSFLPENNYLDEPFDGPNNQCKQENQNRDLVDAVHHTQIEIGWLVGIRFLKHPDKVIAHLAQLEKVFDFIFFRHDT